MGIGNAWEVAEDMGGLADADFSFQAIREHLTKNAYHFGKALFEEARNSRGKERLKYVEGLQKMLAILEQEERKKLLKDLMTNIETVKELRKKALEEIKIK